MLFYLKDLRTGDVLLAQEKKSLEFSRKEEGEEICHEQESCVFATTINDLPESLLEFEIFPKLHNPRDFFACKSVCKSWNSTISSLRFSHDPGFALIVNIPAPDQQKGEPHYATEDSVFAALRGFKLKYLPCFDYRYRGTVSVQASCEDLLLCTKSCKTQSAFYIVNPLTRQWCCLPRTPSRHSYRTFAVGLALKVHDGPGSDDSIQVRYKVVRIVGFHPTTLMAEVYDSETRRWAEVIFDYPRMPMPWSLTHYQGLSFNGALHWLTKGGPIISLDPFDLDQTICQFNHRCEKMCHHHYKPATIKECLTTSQGHLIVLQLIMYPADDEANRLRVWVSTDEGWCLFNEVYFKDMISDIPWLRDYMHEYAQRHTQYKMVEIEKFRACIHLPNVGYPKIKEGVHHKPEPLACHPNNINLVYLHLPRTIAICNLLTKKLKIISEISAQLEFSYYDTVVPIKLKLNPTLVSDF